MRLVSTLKNRYKKNPITRYLRRLKPVLCSRPVASEAIYKRRKKLELCSAKVANL